MRVATVKITPDNEKQRMDVQTGELSDLEMYHHLMILCKHFAENLCKDAVDVVGDDPQKMNEYLEWRIKQSGIQ